MTIKNRFKTFDFWDGAVFGITVSCIIALMIAWLLSNNSFEERRILVTLIAIPVAFIGAFVSLSVVRYQINYARSQELASARAVLPLALTRMVDVANNAILLASGQHTSPPISLEDARALLTLDESVISIIRDNVQFADPVTRLWLSVTIARYQVYFSRIDGWWSSPTPTLNANSVTAFDHTRENALMDWGTFHALVEHHYEYARIVVDEVPKRLDVSKIRSALSHNIFSVTFTNPFEQRIDDRLDFLKDGNVRLFGFTF